MGFNTLISFGWLLEGDENDENKTITRKNTARPLNTENFHRLEDTSKQNIWYLYVKNNIRLGGGEKKKSANPSYIKLEDRKYWRVQPRKNVSSSTDFSIREQVLSQFWTILWHPMDHQVQYICI